MRTIPRIWFFIFSVSWFFDVKSATDFEMVERSEIVCIDSNPSERSICFFEKYIRNDDRMFVYLKYLASFRDLSELASPFTKKDHILFDHLQNMRKKEDFWIGCPTPGCFGIVLAALGGVLGSLYFPTIELQAIFGMIGEGGATYAGYYATGTLPRQVNEAVAAVDQMKHRYVFYYNQLAIYLRELYEQKKGSNSLEIETFVENLRSSLPKLGSRIEAISKDKDFALFMVTPLAQVCQKILHRRMSPVATPPPLVEGGSPQAREEQAFLGSSQCVKKD